MIDLNDAKAHLRVDNNAEDALIQNLVAAAETAVLDYLNLESLPAAPPVHAACLMLVGSLYENRETLSDRPLHENRLFDRLLNPYRVMVA